MVQSATGADPAARDGEDGPEAEIVWRCGMCGYQRMSREQPSACRSCGSGREAFEGRSMVEWRAALSKSVSA